jgi:hypothetical protein
MSAHLPRKRMAFKILLKVELQHRVATMMAMITGVGYRAMTMMKTTMMKTTMIMTMTTMSAKSAINL